MEDLQKIINQSAKKKAENIVKNLINSYSKNDNLSSILGNYYVKITDSKGNLNNNTAITGTLRDVFWSVNDKLARLLIEDLTKVLIPIESQNFVDRVQELENELKILKNIEL